MCYKSHKLKAEPMTLQLGTNQEIFGNWRNSTQTLILFRERANLYFEANGISKEKQLPACFP